MIRLRNADVGEQVPTFDLEHGNAIIVGVNRIPKSWGSSGVCPCTTCAFGCWKKLRLEVPDGCGSVRASTQYVYDVRCPMFDACNAKDRPDHASVNFTKIQVL